MHHCRRSSRGIVLDPFLGSGTTAIVSARNKRGYIGIDISQKYCEMARARLKNLNHELL